MIQLPLNIADRASLLDHRVDPIEGVAAARRHGQAPPGEGATGDRRIGVAHENAVPGDARGAGDVGEPGGERMRQPRAGGGHIAGVREHILVGHSGPGRHIAGAHTGAQGDGRPRHSRPGGPGDCRIHRRGPSRHRLHCQRAQNNQNQCHNRTSAIYTPHEPLPIAQCSACWLNLALLATCQTSSRVPGAYSIAPCLKTDAHKRRRPNVPQVTQPHHKKLLRQFSSNSQPFFMLLSVGPFIVRACETAQGTEIPRNTQTPTKTGGAIQANALHEPCWGAQLCAPACASRTACS